MGMIPEDVVSLGVQLGRARERHGKIGLKFRSFRQSSLAAGGFYGSRSGWDAGYPLVMTNIAMV